MSSATRAHEAGVVQLRILPATGCEKFAEYLYRKEYDLQDDEYIVVNFTPYTTKAGKTMSHIVLSNKDKELTRVIVFPTMYKQSLARMREGMKCKPTLSKLDDGTLMVKEIK